MNPCVLDEQKFRYCCQLLLQQSQQLKDGWIWKTLQVRTGTFLSVIGAGQKFKIQKQIVDAKKCALSSGIRGLRRAT